MKEDVYTQRRIEITTEKRLRRWPETDNEFKTLGAMMINHINNPPLMLKGRHIQEIRAAANVSGVGGFRIVYAQVNNDYSLLRIGSGLPERLIMQVSAYLVKITPEYILLRQSTRKRKKFWSLSKQTFDMIHANGGYLNCIVLAEWLSKDDAMRGEVAVKCLFPNDPSVWM